MTATLTIGTLTMQPDTCYFTIRRQGILGGTNRIVKTRNIWEINGRVQADQGLSSSASMLQVNNLVLALEGALYDGIDLVFSLGSSMNLLSTNCLEGTHVKEFSWLTGYDGVRGSGAEGLLRRTFRLVVFGDVLDLSDTDLTFYSDSLIYTGNGLDNTVPVNSLTGQPQAQTLSLYTPVWVLQTGQAVGMTATPSAATPYFAGLAFYPQPQGQVISYFTPRKWGVNLNTEYGIRWSYKCFFINSPSQYSPPSF